MESNAVWRNVAGFLPAVLWAILVAILSLSSTAMVPNLGWADFTGLDKLGHAVFYCLMALWMLYGFFRLRQRYRNMAIWTWVICVVFGITMELLQAWMRTGRQFEYTDLLANVVGVLIAYCIFNVLLKKKYHGSLRR